MTKYYILLLLLLPATFLQGKEITKHCEKKCVKRIAIRKLPFTICKSGEYFFPCSLKVPKDISGPALKIKAGGVTVDGDQHTILSNNAGTANKESVIVSVPGKKSGKYKFSNIVIKNLTIATDLAIKSAASVTNFIVGAQITGAQNVVLDNVSFINETTGLRLNNVDKVVVTKNLFQDNSANINDFSPPLFPGRSLDIIEGVTDLVVEKSTFRQTNPDENVRVSVAIRNVPNLPTLPLKNLTVKDSQFDGYDSTINFHTGNNIILEGNEIHQNNVTLNAIQVGNFVPGAAVNGVIIRNTTITALNNPPQGYFGILLAQGSGALVENVALVTNAVTVPPPDLELAAAIVIGGSNAVGDPTIVFNNVLIDKVVIAGPNSNGILIDGSKNITIQNSTISEANTNIQTLTGSHNIAINNNEINGPALLSGTSRGIALEGTSQSTVYNNTISNNRTVGIIVDAASANNLIQENRLVHNGPPQIVNNSASTVLDDNTLVT
jgi:parallel beta-helix repeat protein